MTAYRFSVPAALRTAAVVALLAMAACSVNEAGNIPCADDSSCPSDYPVCSAGKCIAGTPTGSDTVQIVSINGVPAASAPHVRGVVHASVVAKASTGVGAVTLTAGVMADGGAYVALVTDAGSAPVYDFAIDTTQIDAGVSPDGVAITLSAAVTGGDKTTAVANATATVDNAAPLLLTSDSGQTLRTGSVLSVHVISNETLDPNSLHAVVTDATGTAVGDGVFAIPSGAPDAGALSYLVSFGITDVLATGSYNLTIRGSDLAGNAVATALVVPFAVRAPVPLSSHNFKITNLTGVAIGGLPAAAAGGSFTAALDLPAGLTPAPTNGIVISLLAPGATGAGTTLTVTGSGTHYSATFAAPNIAGIGTVTAMVTDAAGNESQANALYFVDLNAPELTGLTLSPAYVLDTSQTGTHEHVTVSGTATAALSSAVVTTSNGDAPVGTPVQCKCDGAQCGSDTSSAPLVSCDITVSSAAGAVTATVVLTDKLGNVSPVTTAYEGIYQIVAAPAADSLTVDNAIITLGQAANLTPKFENGQGTICATNDGLTCSGTAVPVSSQIAISVAPIVPTNYLLTVTGPTSASDGVIARHTQQVNVVGVPTASLLTDKTSIDSGHSCNLTLAWTNGVAILNTTIAGVTTSSAPLSAGATSGSIASLSETPAGNASFQLVVTNSASHPATATSSQTVYVGSLASASLSSSTPTIIPGAAVTLVYTISATAVSATINPGNLSGLTIDGNQHTLNIPSGPTGTTIYSLTVTNQNGSPQTATTTVAVTQPVITSFTGPAYATSGTSSIPVTVGFTGAGAMASVTATGWTCTAGVPNASPAAFACTGSTLTANTTFTATVTLGSSAPTATTTVAVAPDVTQTANANLTYAGGTINPGATASLVTTACAGCVAALNPAQGSGSIPGTVTTAALSQTTVFTLSVSNQAGQQAQKTVTVPVAAPTITSFTAPSYATNGTSSLTMVVAFSTTSGTATASVTSSGWSCTAAGPATSSPATFTCTGSTVTADTTFLATVTQGTAAPTATAVVKVTGDTTVATLSPASQTINAGATATLTGNMCTAASGCTATMNPSVTGSLTGSTFSVTTAALTATTVYTLTVTNQAGVTTTKTATVVVAQPSITSFTAPSYATNGTASLTMVVAFSTTSGTATASVTSSGWSCTAAGLATSSPATFTCTGSTVTADTTFLATVTQGTAAPTATALVKMTGDTTVATLSPGSQTILEGNTATLTGNMCTSVSGCTATMNPAVTGSLTGSTFSVTTAALTATTVYTLTVTNQAGVTTTKSATVIVTPGTFASTTGAPAEKRVGAVTVLLPNGKVLVAGGKNGNTAGSTTLTAEIFDPTTKQFTSVASLTQTGGSVASMQVERYGAAAVLLRTGQVYIVGGVKANGSTTATADIYDVATNGFLASKPANSNAARSSATATLLDDGKVLVAGGLDGSGNRLTQAEIWDPASPGTAAVAITVPLGVARAQHTATLLPDGKVAFFGGVINTDSVANQESVELFSENTGTLASSTFAKTASVLSSPRAAHTATVLSDGRLLLIGGVSNSSYSTFGDLLTYNELTLGFNATVAISNDTTGSAAVRSSHTATLLSTGDVLIAGGYDSSGTTRLQTAELVSVSTGAPVLINTNNLQNARAEHGATFLFDGTTVLIGGASAVSAEEFNPN